MAPRKMVVAFVHGWSVTDTETYGGLPARLLAEASAVGLQIELVQVFLGKYISFHDEVRLEDISRAMQAAVAQQVRPAMGTEERFACVTHSTGGPVVRDWWERYYHSSNRAAECPMSHLIMLAPANFGSAFAQLGKSRVGRLNAWWQGVEPGQGVLDWLALGSREAWTLNEQWIRTDASVIGTQGLFPFVLIGQSIYRQWYDPLNSYTGEDGSDGVVRVAAANLNAVHVRLEQHPPEEDDAGQIKSRLVVASGTPVASPPTAMLVVPGKSHSGEAMGIMRSVSATRGERKDAVTTRAMLDCLTVQQLSDYARLRTNFEQQTAKVQQDERLEIIRGGLLGSHERHFFHDRHTMVIFRLRDQQGYPVTDFDLLLTAARARQKADPNRLPEGFLVDRQRNTLAPNTLAFYINYDAMRGCAEVTRRGRDEVYRPAWPGTAKLGLRVDPRPQEGFVHYQSCELEASREVLEQVIKPNQTTLVDSVLRRVVYEEVFRFDRGTDQGSFKDTRPARELGT